jgi:hypothetical protein
VATRSRKLGGSAAALLAYYEPQRAEPEPEPERDPLDEVTFRELWGRGADRLNVSSLTRRQFMDLLRGQWDGEQLTGGGYRRRPDGITELGVHTPGIDTLFTAPKSVSAELLITADEVERAEIIDRFEAAVRAAWTSMEEHAAVARVPSPNGKVGPRMQGGATERVPADLLGMPVLQFSARPTEETVRRESPPDPHLHMHVPVMGVCWAEDGRPRTPDELGIKQHGSEREAVFSGEMARQLEEMGYRLDYTLKGRRWTWEVAGSDPDVRAFFSTNAERSVVVARDFEERYGRPPTNVELSDWLSTTRRRKDPRAKDVDNRPAWQLWREAAQHAGLRIRKPRREALRRAPVEDRNMELWSRVEQDLTRTDSTFRRADLRETIARMAVGLGFDPAALAEVEGRMLQQLVPVDLTPGRETYTTDRLVLDEVDVAEAIQAKQAASLPVPTAGAVARAAVGLNAEQRAAFNEIISPAGWASVEGNVQPAIKAAVAAYRDGRGLTRDAADEVIVVNADGARASWAARFVDADHAWTIEQFIAKAKPNPRTLILLDDAGVVDTHQMAELVRAVGRGRLVAVSQSHQVPDGPGGWLGGDVIRTGGGPRREDKRSAISQLDPEVVAHRRAVAEYGRPAERPREVELEPHWERVVPIEPEVGSLDDVMAAIRRNQEQAVRWEVDRGTGRAI